MSSGNDKAVCSINREARVDVIEKKMEQRFKRGGVVRKTDNWGRGSAYLPEETAGRPYVNVI